MQEQEPRFFRRDVLLGVLGSVILAIGIGTFIIAWRSSDSLESTEPEVISNADVEIIVSQTVAAIVTEMAGASIPPTSTLTPTHAQPNPSITTGPSPVSTTPAPPISPAPILTRRPLTIEPTTIGGEVDNIGMLTFSSNGDIYIVNTDGSGEVKFLSSSANEFSPSWSPDGSQLVFSTDVDGNTEVYTINADGSGLTNLTNNSSNDAYPAWSPDGSKIAFKRYPGGLFVMNKDGSVQSQILGRSDLANRAAWSADSKFLAIVGGGNDDVYVINTDSLVEQVVTDGDGTRAGSQYAWSPLDNRIAVLDNTDGMDDIFVVNTNNWERIRLTTDSTSEGPMTWSPDGQYLAFVKAGDVYATRADGSGGDFKITNNSNSSSSFCYKDISWSPDGLTVACSDSGGILLISVDGSKMQRLSGFDTFWLTWNPSSDLSLSELAPVVPIPTATLEPTSTPIPVEVSESSLRPSGMIAFESDDIYVIDTAKSVVNNLTNSKTYEYYLHWSPDGTKLAFTSEIDGNYEIYTINPDGTALTNLSNNSASDTYPIWSPDGQKILFLSERDRAGAAYEVVYVMNADGTEQRSLSMTGASPLGWSFDSQQIAFSKGRSIYIIGVDGSNQFEIIDNASETCCLEWSPSTLHVALIANQDGKDDLYVVDTSNLQSTRLTANSSTEEFAWSPDGQQIAYTTVNNGEPGVYITDVNGTEQVRLTEDSSINYDSVRWLPDGTHISFRAGKDLYVTDANGLENRLLVEDFDSSAYTWSPDGNHIVFIIDGELYTAAFDGSDPIRWTDSETVGSIYSYMKYTYSWQPTQ